MAKEAYSYGKRGLFIWQKRPVHMAKEAYSYGKKGLQTMACLSNMNRPLLSYKQVSFVTYAYIPEPGRRQASTLQGPIHMSKEAYSYVKRDLFVWHQRPSNMATETYSYGKRDLLIWQKRPTNMAKETY